ncbi:MAG: transglutaminase family protein [Emcibacter sp.]|nr:transglutaminase family protein [Emcibacter sp.]
MNDFRMIIQKEIKSKPGTGEFVEELNNWVYFNKGFAKNNDFYLLSKFGPTAKQILAKGGDCSDKSRLLSTMLKSVGINSTLVMIYGCKTCGATHTIVEAHYDNGRMSADPVFNIVFPKREGEYYGIKELRDNPNLLIRRLDFLKAERGSEDKVSFYKRDTETYSWIKTINWSKNNITQTVGYFIGQFTDAPFLVMRPHFLEDPKLFYSYFLFVMGAMFLMLSIVISWFVRKYNKNSNHTSR